MKFSAVILLAILGVYFFRLKGNAKAVREERREQESIVAQNRTLAFDSTVGEDAFGRHIDFPITISDGRVLVFLLRGASFSEDIGFWRDVQSDLPKTVRLIGYCGDDVCTDAIRSGHILPPFSVICYGEIVSSQALVNADIQGNALLRIGKEAFARRPILWRTSGQTPLNVVHEALK